MSDRTTCASSRSAISSPASVFGAMRFDWLASPTTDLFGPVPARANLSARQAKELGLLTSGTSGLTSIGSSSSLALQRSLESRLRVVTSILGSTLYKLTWKAWVTPSGLSRFRLRASVPRTSETGCIGWPTPSSAVVDAKPRPPIIGNRKPTDPQIGLADVAVHLAAWPTPTACDADRQPAQDFAPTPNMTLNHAAVLAGWPTPLVGSTSPGAHGQISGQWREAMEPCKPHPTTPARLTATGQLLTGSSAAMDAGGQLNPAHPRWLMGLPPEWDACAPMAMPSTRSKRQSL